MPLYHSRYTMQNPARVRQMPRSVKPTLNHQLWKRGRGEKNTDNSFLKFFMNAHKLYNYCWKKCLMGMNVNDLKLQSSPFDVFALHENAQEVDIICDSHGRHYPEDRMSVKAWERFCLFFLFTLKDKETRLFNSLPMRPFSLLWGTRFFFFFGSLNCVI